MKLILPLREISLRLTLNTRIRKDEVVKELTNEPLHYRSVFDLRHSALICG